MKKIALAIALTAVSGMSLANTPTHLLLPSGKTVQAASEAEAIQKARALRSTIAEDFRNGHRSAIMKEARNWYSEIDYCGSIDFPDESVAVDKVFDIENGQATYRVTFDVALANCS